MFLETTGRAPYGFCDRYQSTLFSLHNREMFYNRFTMGNKNRARNLSFGTCSFLGLARDASCVAHYENRVARDENRVERVVTFL